MNGSIALANNATLATVATVAANYGLKTVVDQHSLDIAARITLEVDTKVLSWGPSKPRGGLRARQQALQRGDAASVRGHLPVRGGQGRRRC